MPARPLRRQASSGAPEDDQDHEHHHPIGEDRVAGMASGDELQAQVKKSSWRQWALGVAVLLVVILIAQNSQKVKVKFLFVDTTTPLIFALLIAAILGAVIGYVGPLVRRHRSGD
jgi:uncharacterized integral membrane protein